jgi:hypothetical protein
MEQVDRAQHPFLGSLLMTGSARDEHGVPYQVGLILRGGGWGTEDLVRDELGRVQAWVFDESGRSRQGSRGPLVQVVPTEVAAAAEQWLADRASDD